MGRIINAIRRKLKRGRSQTSAHASLKANVSELRERLNQLFSHQQQLSELTSDMTEQLKGIVSDAKEGFNTVKDADKIADLVKEVRKDMSLGETETEDNASSEEGSDYLSDGTLSEDASCSSGSEEELSCSGDSEKLSCSGGSEEELSCSGGSEEELPCSEDSEEELSCSGDSEEELSCSGDSEEEHSCSGDSDEELSCTGDTEEELSCSDGSGDELSEGEHRSTGLEREFNEEDSFRILTNQSSSDESVQKLDAAEAAERKRLWEEEIKAYYDRMLRERPELFYPVYYVAPQHYSPWQASSSSSVQHQVSSQIHASGLQECTGGEGTNAYTLVGNIQNVPHNTVVTKEEEHQLSYSNSTIDFYENPYSLQRANEQYPFEGSDEPQQSLEQEDQCIQGENEGLTTMSEPVPLSVDSEEKFSQSNGDLLNDDNTSCREVEEGSYMERECSEEDSFRILTNQSSSDESVQKIDAAEAAERKRLWEEEIKAYYDRMLREKPELFYPVHYNAPQHYSPWQASSSAFAQHMYQVSSQEYYASGTANVPSCGCYQCCNSYHRHAQQSAEQRDQSHVQELQPFVGDLRETAYPEYNMWSVQRIVE